MSYVIVYDVFVHLFLTFQIVSCFELPIRVADSGIQTLQVNNKINQCLYTSYFTKRTSYLTALAKKEEVTQIPFGAMETVVYL